MRIGILGGTGPAGSGLAARLASIGHDVVIGSRSKYRAMETVDELVGTVAATRRAPDAGDNAGAADCELDRDGDAVGLRRRRRRRRTRTRSPARSSSSMANALVRVNKEFQPLVPPRGSVAAHVQAAVPRSRVVAAFHHLPATELGHIDEPIDSDVLICGDDPAAVRRSARSSTTSPGADRSMPVSCRTRPRSRRSPRCCSSSTCATRPGWRRS